MMLASNNFQRKLYASVTNMTETMENMVNIKTDVLIGTEPRLASLYNEALLKKTARAYGFDAKTHFQEQDRSAWGNSGHNGSNVVENTKCGQGI